jgi:hypothetical protein
MRRHKKSIMAAVLAGVLLLGSLGGIALADDGDNGPAAKLGEFIDKVIANYEGEGYTIESPEALKQAFADARTDMRAAAIGNRFQGLTDEQKEALREWWDSRPSLTDEQKEALQEWRDSRPEDLPMKSAGRIHRGFHGFSRPYAPAE